MHILNKWTYSKDNYTKSGKLFNNFISFVSTDVYFKASNFMMYLIQGFLLKIDIPKDLNNDTRDQESSFIGKISITNTLQSD